MLTIGPNKFIKVLYGVPRRGRLGIEISASRAVDIYTVPVSQYERWRSHKKFSAGSTFLRRKNLKIEFNSGLEFEEDWYLVLENIWDEPVDIEYDVYEH